MKNMFKKMINILLAVVLCCGCLLNAACKQATPNSGDMPTANAGLLYDPEHGIDRTRVLSSIVKNGSSDYKIVHGDRASETEIYAASEMQSFIYQTTGVKLPILEDGFVQSSPEKLICIGENVILESAELNIDYEELGMNGFVLKTKGTNLYIVGGGNRGTLYGVYDWLEKICGVKFIANDCTYTPTLSELSLFSMDVKEIPEFEYSGYLAAVTATDQVWYARSRNNCEWNETAERYGGGVQWYTPINTAHNSLVYVNPNTYYKTYEDKQNNAHMFLVENGTPVDICYTDGITEDGQLDESMPISAAKVAIESLKTYIQDGTEEMFYMFGHMDLNYTCTCLDCLKVANKYGQTGMYIRFANVLHEEVSKWAEENLNGRKIKLVLFGYALSEMPPVVYNSEKKTYVPIDETVVPREGIYLRLAAITTNRYYTLTDENQLAKWKDWFDKWGALSDDFMSWTYSAVHRQYFWYYPMKHTFVDYLKDFSRIGVKYMFVQGGHTEINDWQSIMDDYLFSKLLWNPNRDINALVEEFVHYYFGELVEDKILQFMNLYDTYIALNQQKDKDIMYDRYYKAEYNKYEDVNAGLIILDECKEMIANSSLGDEEKEILSVRIDRVRLTPLYMLMRNGSYYFADDLMKKNEITNEFFQTCAKLNVIYYGEKLTIDSIKSQYGYNG